MRVAVIDYNKCKPEKCGYLCASTCPVNRSGGDPAVEVSEEDNRPRISEPLCIGCGICVKKCPFGAITIVNLPEEVGTPVHQYGPNAFRLYGLPYPRKGKVVGIIGRNGAGKSTAVRILSGIVRPNLGRYDDPPDWDEVIDHFKGTELQAYFERVRDGKVKLSYKPQEIEAIPRMFSGTVRELLGRIDSEKVEDVAERVGIAHILDRQVCKLSGGELQLLAVAAAIMKEADIYFFDEPSSYLDVKQRLRAAQIIRSLAGKGGVMVVEHDLAVLDYLSDGVFIVYGVPGAYGMVSGYKSVREGINQFLDGVLREENMRIREEPVRFEVRPPGDWQGKVLFEYPSLKKDLGGFYLEVEGGAVREGEIIGILGQNGIGKTTFVRMLAGEIEPDEGKVETELKISYKPQYISFPDVPVSQLFMEEGIDLPFFESEVKRQLEIDKIWENSAAELSGGERQRVAVALCLSREADIYLLDEPSAFLDVDQRLTVSKLIKKVVASRKKLGFVVEHDIVMVDYVSDRLIVFSGEPGKRGKASAPLPMREGMNIFLKELGITFRRDPHTGRPRVNKPGSQKDVEQKKSGEYYYTGA